MVASVGNVDRAEADARALAEVETDTVEGTGSSALAETTTEVEAETGTGTEAEADSLAGVEGLVENKAGTLLEEVGSLLPPLALEGATEKEEDEKTTDEGTGTELVERLCPCVCETTIGFNDFEVASDSDEIACGETNDEVASTPLPILLENASTLDVAGEPEGITCGEAEDGAITS